MNLLLSVDDISSFSEIRSVNAQTVDPQVIETVRRLDEREELEPFIRSALADSGDTPHGPAEIVDIFTHKVRMRNEPVLAAFILKGRSFPTVRPTHVAHQIYRLEKIQGLRLAILATSGIVLDAAKEQFCSTAQRLGCYYALLDAIDLGRLFIAYGFICPRDGSKIVGGRCRCGYRPTHRVPNVLQEGALRELALAHELRQPAGLVVLPPGSGKTSVAALDANRRNAERVLYVAHSHEILESARTEFEDVFGQQHVVHHRTSHTLRGPAKINLATIQLLARHLPMVRSAAYDYLVVDEFHHAAAPSYRRLLEAVGPAFLLGLTATPFREDRKDILRLCGDNMLVQSELRTGIEAGILCPYHYFGCFDDIDYSDIQYNGQRYTVHDLERALIVPEREEAIARKWWERADGKPTLAFCCSHRHAARVVANFKRLGIPSEVYLSDTPRAERQMRISRLESGELKILCTVDVLNEGIDLPFVECLLFLRPTESKRIFYQQLGRGLRRFVGKSHCIVLDFIGNFRNAYRLLEFHGLDPFEYEAQSTASFRVRRPKDLLNLPVGCEVHFDERVIDVFARQTLDPRHATRHNIARILLYQLVQLQHRIGRVPRPADVDRNCLLDMRLYRLVFGGLPDISEVG